MKEKKINAELCPNCKTGADSYLLDSKNPFCPYQHLHNGQTCIMFERLKGNK